MNTIFDYLEWRGDVPFALSPFNEVDSALLALLVYVDFTGFVAAPGENGKEKTLTEVLAELPPPVPELVAEAEASASVLAVSRSEQGEADTTDDVTEDVAKLEPNIGLERPQMRRLCELVSLCPRYAELTVFDYCELFDVAKEKQFAALSFRHAGKALYLAFRGTDNSLIGWKEDFNMTHSPVVPAQEEAYKYLQGVAERNAGPLYLCGHSKGGNLALFAAVCADRAVQDRIERVDSFDGPGLSKAVLESPRHERILPKIKHYVPVDSVFGMMLESASEELIVEAQGSGLEQHDLFNWAVGRQAFERRPERSAFSHFFDVVLKDWLNSATAEQREKFVDTCYALLCTTDAQKMSDLQAQWLKHSLSLMRSYRKEDEQSRAIIKEMLRLFYNISYKQIRESLAESRPLRILYSAQAGARSYVGRLARQNDEAGDGGVAAAEGFDGETREVSERAGLNAELNAETEKS